MTLHDNPALFSDAILATAEHLGIREVYVEKDYWLTLALYDIFHSPMADQAVFKGGTALSKCYGLIERFSEDLDLVVVRNEGETDAQLKRKLRAISRIVAARMPEIEVKGLTNKKGNIRKTVHRYDHRFDGDWGQAREHIVVEATWLGNAEPHVVLQVHAYIYDMVRSKDQDAFIERYRLAPFELRVLSKQRTFCEKVMSLVRFSRTDNPIDDLRNKIRHVYDIHQMLQDEEVDRFVDGPGFSDMLIRVGRDDVLGYRNHHDWLFEHPSTALIFESPGETWERLSPVYHGTFRDLVLGDLPAEDALVETLRRVAVRLQGVAWHLA